MDKNNIETTCKFTFAVSSIDPIEAEHLRDLLHDVARLMGYEIWTEGLSVERRHPELPKINISGISMDIDPDGIPEAMFVWGHQEIDPDEYEFYGEEHHY